MKDPLISLQLPDGTPIEGYVSQFVELEKHPNMKRWIIHILKTLGGKIEYAGRIRGNVERIDFTEKKQFEREKAAAKAAMNYVRGIK